MTYINIKEIWTPLKWGGIRLYRDIDTKQWYIKRSKYERLRRLRRKNPVNQPYKSDIRNDRTYDGGETPSRLRGGKRRT